MIKIYTCLQYEIIYIFDLQRTAMIWKGIGTATREGSVQIAVRVLVEENDINLVTYALNSWQILEGLEEIYQHKVLKIETLMVAQTTKLQHLRRFPLLPIPSIHTLLHNSHLQLQPLHLKEVYLVRIIFLRGNARLVRSII